jgi:ribonuclease HI
VAAAAVTEQQEFKCRLADNASIFTVELKGIELALSEIETTQGEDFVIFSDSMSSLQALEGDDWLNPMVFKVKEKLNSLQTNLDKHVTFVWIPSHVGIGGNEKTDVAAKAALDLPVSDMKIPHSDFKCLINPYIKRKWQTEWDAKIENKLLYITYTWGLGKCLQTVQT